MWPAKNDDPAEHRLVFRMGICITSLRALQKQVYASHATVVWVKDPKSVYPYDDEIRVPLPPVGHADRRADPKAAFGRPVDPSTAGLARGFHPEGTLVCPRVVWKHSGNGRASTAAKCRSRFGADYSSVQPQGELLWTRSREVGPTLAVAKNWAPLLRLSFADYTAKSVTLAGIGGHPL